ncbi:MqnA/MqnD/SBP family protein [Peptoniphilus raoultii]|uniref:MqnA/MqnD/SBP family protein n=1 Tax=Peptoniphilus raoultii TaxID=1776387 RepID=UPI0008DA33FE|nr:MqnA/MqnD/SBP family protein [Peptoniphilus raoultii]
MKKKFTSLVSIFLMALLLAGCSSNTAVVEKNKTSEQTNQNVAIENSNSKNNSATKENDNKEKTLINLGALKGPTSLGLVKLFSDSDGNSAANDYKYTIYSSPDEVVTGIVKGELDLAAVPANLAAVLYQKTEGKIKVLNINTLGVLYIASRNDIAALDDLKGKTIITSGKGATPEYALRYILKENGIDPDKDVNIEFKSEHQEVVQSLAKDENGIAMLPEPFLTVAKTKIDGLKTNFSLTDLWDKLPGDSMLVTGVMIARADFLDQNKEVVDEFLKEYQSSIDYVNSNIDDAAALSEKYDIVKAPIAKKAIPACNIHFIAGEDMKKALSEYLNSLFTQDPKTVGGQLPDENFYYQGQ